MHLVQQCRVFYFFYSGVIVTFATIHKDILFPRVSMKVTVNLCNINLSYSVCITHMRTTCTGTCTCTGGVGKAR